MSSEVGFLEERIDRASLPLAAGDLLVIAVVLSLGASFHDATIFSRPGELAMVLAPFLVGWVIAAPLIGAYSVGAQESRSSVALVIRSWIPADIIGLAIRATPFVDGGIEPIFVAITLVTVGVGLVGFRLVAARLY
jgi:hypothetical protein